MMPQQISIDIDDRATLYLEAVVRVKPYRPAGVLVRLTTKHAGITFVQTGGSHMSYTLPADKQVQLQIEYVDANGNPATIDGDVFWESSNPSVADVLVQPENTHECALVAGDEIGNCQISAKADADLGEGTRELVTLLDVTVVGGEAVTGTITPVGEQTPK